MEDNKRLKLKEMYKEFNDFCRGNLPWPVDCGDEKLSDVITEFLQVCGDVDSWVASVRANKPLNWESIELGKKINDKLIHINPKTELDRKALLFCKEFRKRVDAIINLLLEFKPK